MADLRRMEERLRNGLEKKEISTSPVKKRRSRRDRDNLVKRGKPDRSRINVREKWELAYWSHKFGITPARLSAIVKQVGASAQAVENAVRLLQSPAAKSGVVRDKSTKRRKRAKTSRALGSRKRAKKSRDVHTRKSRVGMKKKSRSMHARKSLTRNKSRDLLGGARTRTRMSRRDPVRMGSPPRTYNVREIPAKKRGRPRKYPQIAVDQYGCVCKTPKKRSRDLGGTRKRKGFRKAPSRKRGGTQSYRDVMRNLGYRN